jgi:hypothetical protein
MVGYITLYDYVTFVHTYVLVVVERSRSIVQCKWSIQICWFKKINLNRLFSLFVFSNIKMTYNRKNTTNTQVLVSMMLTYQPFYIGGIEDVEQAKRNAYGGVGTFLFIFILSVVYLVLDALRGDSREINNIGGTTSSSSGSGGSDTTRRRQGGGMGGDYEGVPTSTMIGGGGSYSDNLELPPSVEQAHFT